MTRWKNKSKEEQIDILSKAKNNIGIHNLSDKQLRQVRILNKKIGLRRLRA